MKCSEKKFEDFRFLRFHLERKCYLLRLEKKNNLKKTKDYLRLTGVQHWTSLVYTPTDIQMETLTQQVEM